MDTTETRAPAATKTRETVALYDSIYKRLEKMVVADAVGTDDEIAEGESPTPMQVVATFRLHEGEWSKSTAKLYRVALDHSLGMGTPDAYAAKMSLRREYAGIMGGDDERIAGRNSEDSVHDSTVKAMRASRELLILAGKEVPKTSSRKAKRLTKKDMSRLLNELENSGSQWRFKTLTWFKAGYLTGLRPKEWATSAIEVDAAGRKILVVHNAKNTNGRTFGPIRSLVIEHLSADEIDLLRDHCDLARAENAAGRFAAFYDGCRSYMNACTSRLWPARAQRPTLYTARHMFASNAKTVFTKTEVAALMGHASDRTAGLHYGRRRSATGSVGIEPSQADVMAVSALNVARNNKTPGSDSPEGNSGAFV